MDKRHGSMAPVEQVLVGRQVIDDILARTDGTVSEAVVYLRAALRLTLDDLATLAHVPAPVIEGIEQGRGTVEELGKLLGVVGLKLSVVRPSAPGSARPASVDASRDNHRRIGIAKGVFDVPEELSYPYDAEWDAMPDVGLEALPAYVSDTAAWATDQANALRNRDGAKLDWDRLADEILDVAKAEERELGRRVADLMASLAKQDGHAPAPGSADARLVREQRKLVSLQLSQCPSLQKCLSSLGWLSCCWSDAVVALGTAGFPIEELPEDNPWEVTQLLNAASTQG